jgi:hypothetical protein
MFSFLVLPMTTFLVALLVFVVAFAAMAVGLLGNRQLRGTCGGTSNHCQCGGRSACVNGRDRSSDQGGSA